MKIRPRSIAAVLSLAFAAQGCGGSVAADAKVASAADRGTADAAAQGSAPSAQAPEAMPVEESAGVTLAAAPAGAPPAAPSAAGEGPGSQVTAAPSSAATAADAERRLIAEARRMVDIEARVSVEVEDVPAAASRVRKLVEKSGGQITNESLTANAGGSRAELSLRVPAEAANDFFSALEGIGAVRSRQLTSKDIGKEYYDATIRLGNLEAARKRYEEILAQAKTIEEILRLEGELTRIRQQIEQLKGEIRWMRDRAARATIHVSLYTESEAPPPPILAPQAKLFPGVRGSYLHDFRGDDGNQGYLGAGLSIGATPELAIELQGFREVGSDTEGLDGFFATLGYRFYSEFLGDGNRPYLNPYLGLRGGYARFLEQDEILLGGQLGLELFKGEWYVIDAEVRSYVLFGSEAAGGHLGVEPTLGASVAF